MNSLYQKAWLISHYSPDSIVTGYQSIKEDDLIIAVDGGYQKCLELKLAPHLLIGDLDSIEHALLKKVPASCQRIVYPRMKDETDTQLALQFCIKENIPEVIICNDLTGRFDHSFALIQNLLQAHQNGLKAKIISQTQIITILDETNIMAYPVKTILSLISLSERTEFTSSQGLAYPLDNLTLYNWQSKGISNTISEPTQYIKLSSGSVLAIVTPQL